MATSGTATVTTGLLGEKKVEKAFQITLASGLATFVITLDQTFKNDPPKMLAVPPQGANGDYVMSYTEGTPSLTCTVGGVTPESNLGANAEVNVIVVAYDQP